MNQYAFDDSDDDDECRYYYYDSEEENSVNDGLSVVERGPVSTICKTFKSGFGSPGEDVSVPRWLAVKVSTINPQFARQPHDIIKEARLLSGLSHINIITLFYYTDDQPSCSRRLWMPFIPFSFDSILSSPNFSPFPTPSISLVSQRLQPTNPTPQSSLTSRFLVISKSLTFQIISALAYLHSPPQCIAHRDIKPRNLLITEQGCIKLIDFGVSWKSDETEKHQDSDLWPERKEEMCAAVSTGPYRAPELLFGAKSYNAFATDLWSLGTTFAELFTTLAFAPSDLSASDVENADTDTDTDNHCQPDGGCRPFILRPSIPLSLDENEYRWFRTSLFSGGDGELALIWSIFKTMGTPTETIWPGYKDLSPTSVTFRQVPGVSLESLLPNLPPTGLPSSTPSSRTHAVDLISRLLVYPPDDRLTAQGALNHPWLTSNDEVPLLLPLDYPLRQEHQHLKNQVVTEWNGKSLGNLVKEVLGTNNDDKKYDPKAWDVNRS